VRRAARTGVGWYGFNLADPAHARERITRLRTLCETAGRDPSELDIAVALAYPPRPEDHDELTRLGVDELVLVAAPPADPAQADSWIRELQLHSG
jgi:hypothetical protein